MRKNLMLIVVMLLALLVTCGTTGYGEEEGGGVLASNDLSIFDDSDLLNGYVEKYMSEDLDFLMAIIQDETVTPFKTAAAVKVFREQFAQEIFSREKLLAERALLRRLNRTDSPFVQVEIMHCLSGLDRYKYFTSMVPLLIYKLDHYNDAVNENAFSALNDIIEKSNNRPREARIVFNTLRKILFLNRKRMVNMLEPDPRLLQKFHILRWSLKVLGTQEIQRLPKEVINLL